MIEQAVVPLVMVTVPAAMLQPPEVVMATARPELLLAATGKLAPNTALAGGAVVTLIVWLAI
jgi:hypothetical protein